MESLEPLQAIHMEIQHMNAIFATCPPRRRLKVCQRCLPSPTSLLVALIAALVLGNTAAAQDVIAWDSLEKAQQDTDLPIFWDTLGSMDDQVNLGSHFQLSTMDSAPRVQPVANVVIRLDEEETGGGIVRMVPNQPTLRPITANDSLAYEDPSLAYIVAQAEQPPLGDAPTTDGTGAVPEDQRFGEEPEQSVRTQFLSQQAVLLKPGQWQFDYGVSYAWQDRMDPFPVLVGPAPGIVAVDRQRRRLFVVPFAFRYGVTDHVQAFINVPVGWANGELVNPVRDTFETQIGISDISAGFNVLLVEGQCGHPDVVGTFGAVAPTGDDSFASINPAAANLGNGFWNLVTQLTFIYQIDPAVLFWGFGYNYRVADDKGTLHVEPGGQVNYEFGVGYALNDRVSVSTKFFGSYVAETQINGLGIPGSTFEPMSIQLETTVLAHENLIIEPFFRFGINEDASDANIGVVFTRTSCD